MKNSTREYIQGPSKASLLSRAGGLSGVMRDVILATSLFAGQAIGANAPVEAPENTPVLSQASDPVNTPASGVALPSNIRSEDIWNEYDEKGSQKPKVTEKIKEKTLSWLLRVLKLVGGGTESEETTAPKEPTLDHYLLSRIGKEYLEKNKDPLVQKYPGKALVLALHRNLTGQGRGQFVLLPIPRLNPNNETIESGDYFLTPFPKANGYNTEYQIKSRDEGEVIQLALLYSMEKDNNPANQKTIASVKSAKKKIVAQVQKKASPEYFSYIPYTQKLDTRENQQKGLEYLSEKMQEVYATEFGKKISAYPSMAPGLSIEEALPYEFPLVINIIERMDYQPYFERDGISLKDKKTLDAVMEAQIARSLTIFGLNEQDSFNHQTSRVGALGVGQMMKTTFERFKNHVKYRVFFSGSDFQTAARSHHESFRLQITHFDDQICQFPAVIRNNWRSLIQDEKTRPGMIAVLAAGYNGDASRVSKEVFGDIHKDAPLEKFKERLAPESISQAMKKSWESKMALYRQKILLLEDKLSGKNQNSPSKNKHFSLKKLPVISSIYAMKIRNDIANIKKDMADATNTYKESMTYAEKMVFVSKYFQENFSM